MRLWAAVVAGLILCACATPPQMPSFALVDHSGTTVRSESFRGYVLVVSFVFTRCVEACPLITAQLARAQTRARAQSLDARVRFISITLDPVTDTPEVLRRYADAYGIDLRTWHFLTGAPPEVGRVISAFGLTTVAGDRIPHGSLVLLVDRKGSIAERLTSLELDPDRLIAALRKLS
jgi:protein SCO1